jgi:hypothetical protein
VGGTGIFTSNYQFSPLQQLTINSEMDRLQAALGPGGVRWGGDALRPVRTHLVAGHCPFQQVT